MSWRLWAKALGEKAGRNKKEADIVALIRTAILFSYIVTNVFIVAGVVRHWNRDRGDCSALHRLWFARAVSGESRH